MKFQAMTRHFVRPTPRWSTTLLLLVVASLGACQEPRDRPPQIGCSGEGCRLPPTLGGGGRSQTADSGGADVPADAVATVSGTLQVLASDDFQVRVPLAAPAEVRAEAASGGEVNTLYDGTNPFLLEGALFASAVWIAGLPELAPEEAMPTLNVVDTTLADPVMVSLVRGQTLDLIYNVLTAPTARATGAGQVVLRFVSDSVSPTPLAGVGARMSAAEITVYDTGGGFSDTEATTGSLGIALFANVRAVPLPGSEHTVQISGPVSTSLKVRVAADTATFVEVPLRR
jgi:hypothetical protein